MRFHVRHRTHYIYGGPAPITQGVLRLLPRDRGAQVVERAALAIEPTPTWRVDRTDFFGNAVTHVTLGARHEEAIFALDAVVSTAPASLPAETPAFEAVRDAALAHADLSALAPAHFAYPTLRTPMLAPVTAYARESFPAGRAALPAAMDLMARIKADFAYVPSATDVNTPLASAFETRRGVCQDFAHIMIAGLRGLGLPAAYVSGYLRTIPPPGRPRLEGADASHAWVSVWCGPEAGWVGLDPTNAIPAGEDHVVLAIGRDYADVAPVDGVFQGYGEQKLKVAVDVTPLG